jgi:hypothetical protein
MSTVQPNPAADAGTSTVTNAPVAPDSAPSTSSITTPDSTTPGSGEPDLQLAIEEQ